MKKLVFIIALIPALIGCRFAEKIGHTLYDPVVETNTFTTNVVVKLDEVIELTDGTKKTNIVQEIQPVQLTSVSTNEWVLKPSLEKGIAMAGDVAPVPWAGPVSTAIITALGFGAHLMGRKYKKAAVAGVQAASEFRTALRKEPGGEEADQQIKSNLKIRQRADGSWNTVNSIINEILK